MSRSVLTTIPQLTAAFLLVSCSSATQRAFVAPSDETVYSETTEQHGDTPAQVIQILNRSTVPVVVFSVSLRNCENVKQQCAPKRTNLRIDPGGRVVAMRVQPDNPALGYRYYFSFGWRADSSGTAALGVLAAGGDTRSQQQLSSRQRADSIGKSLPGPRYHEFSRDDFSAMAGRIARLRVLPDTLTMAPGEQTTMHHVRVLVVDDAGQILGRTQWLQWVVSGSAALEFTPPDLLTARRPGRATIRFRLPDEVQQLVGRPVEEVELPVVVAYRADPTAPVFAGRLIDAETQAPLACARVALEDSVENIVNRARSKSDGSFEVKAPHAGAFRLRVEMFGWAPFRSPVETAGANERTLSDHAVRFDEEMLPVWNERSADYERARPAAVTTEPIPPRSSTGRSTATPLVSGVTLGGSQSMPILGIIGRVQPMTTWMQFVVDPAGRVDTATIVLPPGTPASAKASVKSVIPRVRFSPAREEGTPVCELVRMQVNFSSR